jgi:hypothetical protein
MTLDTASIVTILGLLGGGGILGLLGKLYGLRKSLDDKQSAEKCRECHKALETTLGNLRDEVHARANQRDIDAHAAILADHGKSLAVLEANLQALTESTHRIERMVEKLVAQQ